MPVDVEQQLAALGRFWNTTIAHVETSEIAAHGPARSNGPIIGIDGSPAAPAPDQPRRIHQATEEDATMIELETPSRTSEHRRGPKRVVVAGLLAAAAVVAIAVVAIRRDEPVSPADQPSTTVTVPPTTPPKALFGAADVQLAPGTYFVDEVDGAPTTRILVTLGDGWRTNDPRWAVVKGDSQAMTFSRPQAVYLDACHPGDGYHPGPLDTVDGLVAALSEQGGWIDVTTPTDISIDGYAGKAFQRAVPSDLSNCSFGTLGEFTSWDGPFHSPYYNSGETSTIWVLDVNDTIIVLETRVERGQWQPTDAHVELARVLDSIRIAPG